MKETTKIQKYFVPANKLLLLSVFYVLSVLAAIILPLIIWKFNLSIVARTYDGSVPGMLDSQPFEVFGLFISVVLTTITWLQVQQRPKRTLTTLIPIILPLLVVLNLLFVIIETSHVKSSDYMCYENAARAIINGVNPYTVSPQCYIYPPLLAQLLAFLYQISTDVPLFSAGNEKKAWDIVFYFYQCNQLLQIVLAYFLMYLFAKKIGFKSIPASLLVAALFLFNNPLFRTLKFSQVNLWILNSFLAAILLLSRYPLFSGLLVALGGHMKLYSLSLILPWSFTKKWQAVNGVIIGFLAILIVQTGFGKDWNLWQQFYEYFKNVEKPSNYRNNGLYGIVFNSFKLPNRLTGLSFDSVPTVVTFISIALIIWFSVRFINRERAYSKQLKAIESSDRTLENDVFRLYGHSIDAIMFSLLISPSVWEHHYVIAMPVALWAIATRRRDRPWLVCLGIFLIFCLPTCDFFPLSYHRVAGLLILAHLTNPYSVQNYFKLQNKKAEITSM